MPTSSPSFVSGPDRGLVFDRPVWTPRSSAVLVTNTTDRVMTFTVRAEFRRGETRVATATGLVADLLPGRQRAALLDPAQECRDQYDGILIGTEYDAVRVGVERVLSEAATTPEAETASCITFEQPEIVAGRLRVGVTSRGRLAAFTFQVALLRRGALVDLATGLVSTIQPGRTRSVELPSFGRLPGYDRMLVEVDTVLPRGHGQVGSSADPVEMPFEPMYGGRTSGLWEHGQYVVDDPIRWHAVWGEIIGGASPKSPPPPVDFDAVSLLVVAFGSRPDRRYSVEITRVVDNGRFVEVEVVESAPRPFDAFVPAVSHAFHVVKIPKVEKRIVFKTARIDYHRW